MLVLRYAGRQLVCTSSAMVMRDCDSLVFMWPLHMCKVCSERWLHVFSIVLMLPLELLVVASIADNRRQQTLSITGRSMTTLSNILHSGTAQAQATQ